MTSALEPTPLDESHIPGVPLMAVDPADSPGLDVPTTGAADRSGGPAATGHPLALGHRRSA
ncbi:hypothetical protein GCM10023238_24980 [Streptomyces heliomycini]